MKSTLKQIPEINKHGYHLDIGEVISQTFENYKKIALLSGAVVLLLTILIVIGAIGIGGILGIAIGFTDFLTEYSMGSLGITGVLFALVVGVIGNALVAPIYAGILQIAHNAETNHDFDFSTAFSHYKGKHVKDIILCSILINFFSSGLKSLLDIVNLYLLDPSFSILIAIVVFIIGVLTYTLTFLALPLILFSNLSAIEAIKASISLVAKKFWIILLLIIIFWICACLGIFALCIGIFFTLPIVQSLQYITFRNAVPLEEKDELDEIGSSEY